MALTDTDKETLREFRETVNMTASELEKWLASPESQEVGQKLQEGGESTGHASGRRIVDLLHTKQADLTEDDVAHMRKVIGYCHRHLAQRPEGDISDTHWRYSLMNWGHDPLKEK